MDRVDKEVKDPFRGHNQTFNFSNCPKKDWTVPFCPMKERTNYVKIHE